MISKEKINKIKALTQNPYIKDLLGSSGYYVYKLYDIKKYNDKKKEVILDINVFKGNLYTCKKDNFLKNRVIPRSIIHLIKLYEASKKAYIDILYFTRNKDEAENYAHTLKAYLQTVKHEALDLDGDYSIFRSGKLYDDMADIYILNNCLKSNTDILELIILFKTLKPDYLNKNNTEVICGINEFCIKNNIEYKVINENNEYKVVPCPKNKGLNYIDTLEDRLISYIHKNFTFNMGYYVYRHYAYNPETNEEITLYIGKGSNNRATNFARPTKWIKAILEKHKKGFFLKIDIIRCFKKEEDALNLEKALISYYSSFGECESNSTCKNIPLDEVYEIIKKLKLI